MYSLADELSEVEQRRQQLMQKESLIKEQRKYQIGALTEQCGILALPDEKIYNVFMELATHQYYK